jgi:hypothetical protein
MDEGFSTGDLRFAERAAERMNDFLGRSRIIVLASHSDETIKSMCNKSALMREGQILAFGPVDDVLEQYREMVHGNNRTAGLESAALATAPLPDPLPPLPDPPVYSEDTIRDVGLADRLTRTSGAVRITKATALDENGEPRWTYVSGETVIFRFEYEVLQSVPSLGLLFRLYLPTSDPGGHHIISQISKVLSTQPLDAGRRGGVQVILPRMTLSPNEFLLYVWLGRAEFRNSYDVIDTNVNLPPLTIGSRNETGLPQGVVAIEHEVRDFEIEQPVNGILAGASL